MWENLRPKFGFAKRISKQVSSKKFEVDLRWQQSEQKRRKNVVEKEEESGNTIGSCHYQTHSFAMNL